MGKFRSVSLWEVQQLQNALMKEKDLLEKGWDTNIDVIPVICTDFSEPLLRQL